MKSYCVKEKRETECVPGTEQMRTASNGRQMMVCQCASCGITKTQFLSGQIGGTVGDDFSCGYNLKGKRPGTLEECFRKGQIRRWGVKKFDKDDLDDLLYDRRIDIARRRKKEKKAVSLGDTVEMDSLLIPKRKSTRKPAIKPMSRDKRKEYIDEIVADIKKETKARRKPAVEPIDYQPAIDYVLKMNPNLKEKRIKEIKADIKKAEKNRRFYDETLAEIDKKAPKRRRAPKILSEPADRDTDTLTKEESHRRYWEHQARLALQNEQSKKRALERLLGQTPTPTPAKIPARRRSISGMTSDVKRKRKMSF